MNNDKKTKKILVILVIAVGVLSLIGNTYMIYSANQKAVKINNLEHNTNFVECVKSCDKEAKCVVKCIKENVDM